VPPPLFWPLSLSALDTSLSGKRGVGGPDITTVSKKLDAPCKSGPSRTKIKNPKAPAATRGEAVRTPGERI
jgi:hypothetical protein